MSQNLFIGAYWKEDHSTAKDYLLKSFEFISELKSVLNDFDHVQIVDVNAGLIPFPGSKQLYLDKMLDVIYNDDAWYTKPNGERNDEITMDSMCDMGFFGEYLFENEADLFQLTIAAGKHTSISAEGDEYGGQVPNSVVISFPENFKIIENLSLVKKLITAIVSHWNPELAAFTSHELLEKIKNNTALAIGWLTYVENDGTKVFHANDKIDTEKLSNGTLISISVPAYNEEKSDLDKVVYVSTLL